MARLEREARPGPQSLLNRPSVSIDDGSRLALQSFSVGPPGGAKSCMMAARPPQGDAMPRAFTTLCLTFAIAFLAALAPPVSAEPVSASDTKAVRAVVEAQLAAFAADDAKRAFSYAAPAIREMFGTPERFVAMVRAGYPVVYRPTQVNFLHPVWVDGRLVQGVHLTDAEGALWLAIYRLERQPDASWRISGCEVQPATGKIV
jgi:Domain of unknown function (DUF4864)